MHITKSRVPSVKPVIIDLVAFGVPKTVLFLQKFLNKPLSAQFSVHTTHMGIGRLYLKSVSAVRPSAGIILYSTPPFERLFFVQAKKVSQENKSLIRSTDVFDVLLCPYQ